MTDLASQIMCGLQPNYLQTNGYQLVLPRFPEVTYFSAGFSFPAMNLPPAVAQTPFSKIPLVGDKLEFDPFIFRFIVDEKMNNYKEIFTWMKSISVAEQYPDYTNYPNKSPHEPLGEQTATLAVLSGKSNPVAYVNFYNVFPISLSGFEMSSQDPQTNYVMAQAAFAYTHFDFV